MDFQHYYNKMKRLKGFQKSMALFSLYCLDSIMRTNRVSVEVEEHEDKPISLFESNYKRVFFKIMEPKSAATRFQKRKCKKYVVELDEVSTVLPPGFFVHILKAPPTKIEDKKRWVF